MAAIGFYCLLFLVATGTATVDGLTCFKYFQNLALGMAAGHSVPQQVSNCSNCQKIIALYNSPSIKQKIVQYECGTAPPPTLTAPDNGTDCQNSVTIAIQNEGTMATKACTCCKDRCNNEKFCEDVAPLIGNVFGSNEHRRGSANSLMVSQQRHTGDIVFLGTVTALLVKFFPLEI